MKNYFLISAVALVTGLAACQSAGNHSTDSAIVTGKTTVSTKNDTVNVYNAYLRVKDKLVKTDGTAARQAADSLSLALSSIKGCTQAADLAKQMSATNDVKSQRILFLQVSQDIIPLVKGMKTKTEPIYVAYCPMADGGKGGYWLSAQKEIKNPYYGDEMLECGEVKEEIK